MGIPKRQIPDSNSKHNRLKRSGRFIRQKKDLGWFRFNLRMGRYSAKLAYETPVCEHLVRRRDVRYPNSKGNTFLGQLDLNAVPGKACVSFVALLVPGQIGTDQLPLRIVKLGRRPPQLSIRVIPRVESPKPFQLHDWHTICV